MSDKTKDIINEALYNFYREADSDIINDSLKDNILDFQEYKKKKRRIIFLAKAKAREQHNESLLELVNKLQEGIKQNIEKPIAILKQLIQNNKSFALYRNLDKLSKEDIMEIIKDKDFVELLEKLDKDEESH